MSSGSWTANPLWQTAGWTMLHYLWVGAVIGIIVVALRKMLDPADHRLRYCCAVASLAVLAVVPLGIAASISATSNVALSSPFVTKSDGRHLTVASRPSPPAALPDITRADFLPTVAHAESPANMSARAETRARSRSVATLAAYLPWLWLFGAPLTFGSVGTGIIGAERLRRQSRLPAEGELLLRFRHLSRSLEVSQRVGLGVCDRIAAPVLVGIIRPVILVPAIAATGWSGEQIEMVLLHELAHIRRWDNLVNLLQRLIESLLFFQPAVWVVSDWVRQEREHCCDDFVVSYTGRAHAYAETLAAIAGVRRTFDPAITPGVITSFMARNHLVGRIRHILHPEADRLRVSGKALTATLSLSLLLLFSIGWFGTRSRRAAAAEAPQVASELTGQELDAVRRRSVRKPVDPSHARVTGVVVDEQGDRVANARVSAMDWTEELSNASTSTDADGIFVLDLAGPLTGLTTVKAQSMTGDRLGLHQFHDQSNPVREQAIRIVLKDAQRVTVQVRDAQGTPVPEALVEAIALYKSLEVGQTDASGAATLLLPKDAKVDWIFARKSGLGCDYFENFTKRPILDATTPPEAVSLVLRGARTVQIQALGPADIPLADFPIVPITLKLPGKSHVINIGGSQTAVSRTDTRGIAQFDWLPAAPEGVITFVPRSRTYHSPRWVSTSESDPAADLKMPLVSSVRLSGRVLHADGQPAAGIMLQAEGRGGAQYGRHYARTAADGTYEMDAYPNQTYIIAVLDRKWAAKSLTDIAVGGGPVDGLDLQLLRGTVIRGTMTFAPETHPELRVATLIEQAGNGSQNLVQWTYPDDAGNYEFRVGPGQYKLTYSGATSDLDGTHFITVADEPEILVSVRMPQTPAAESGDTATFDGIAARMTYQQARELAQKKPGFDNLKRIGLAFHGYHDIFGRFPPASVFGPDGKTKHSWRVELLPLLKHYVDGIEPNKLTGGMGREQFNALIKDCGYDVTQPWDSDANAEALQKMPEDYRHPHDPAGSTESAYYAVTGVGAAFEEGHVSSYDDIKGWVASTLMIAESRSREPWTKPVDIPYSADAVVPQLGGYTSSGALVLTCDGAVHFLQDTVSSTDLRALITRSQDDKFDIAGIPYDYGE